MNRAFFVIVDGKPTCWSAKRKIAKKFVKGYRASHPESNVTLGMVDSERHIIDDGSLPPALELTKVHKIYLPRKYVDCYMCCGRDEIDKINDALAILNKALPLNASNIKEKMLSAIAILNNVKEDYEKYVPSISELEITHESVTRWRECSGLLPY